MVLLQANQRWHAQLDRSYQVFLESLTALDLEQARQQWSEFRTSLLHHIEFEQSHIEPLAKNWQDNTLKLIQADHLILVRLLPRLETALERIEHASAPRSELVNQLDTFIKLRNVLEHHDQRENEMLYPVLEDQLDQKARITLATQMNEAAPWSNES